MITRARRHLAVVAAALAAVVTGFALDSATEASATKITICHATGNGGWVVESPSASGVISGHAHHGRDIIPAFAFDRGRDSFHFAGLNLGPIGPDGVTGAEILANGCRLPARPSATAPAATEPATTAVPTPDSTAVPPTAPDTTTPTPTPAPTAVPPTVAPGAPTTAPFPPVTAAAACPPGEFAHAGSCFPIPPLSVPTVDVPTVAAGGATPVPIVECTTRRADGIVTWFGYHLAGDDPVRVERGADNTMSPNGQPPTLFGPGVHLRVLSAVSPDGAASWTIGSVTATSDASTPDCDAITDVPTVPDTTATDTTTPDTTEPGATAPPATDQPATTDPATTTDQPTSTDPATTDPATTDQPASTDPTTTEPGACAAGEREVDGDCVPVAPVELVLVDNYLECDGHGVARFAAFNTNGFALGGPGFSSVMSPQRFGALAPQVIGDEPIASDDGRDLAEFVDVRYVTAVSWTVVHDGIETTIGAGVDGARSNPACPSAHVESTGLDGGSPSPTTMATTGLDTAGSAGIIATLLGLTGALVVLISRRDPESIA